jgi:transcriptional regulator with GAF, ATPase, and Fis domain/serine/threonine protein kinase
LAGEDWRFELLERAGQGATSDVWRARDRQSGTVVALKIARDQHAATILAAEAERLACAASLRLPELIDLGTSPGQWLDHGDLASRPYLAMSWMPGRALDQMDASDEQRLEVAYAVARDVGDALAHLHAAGVAHGDVKPSNIQLYRARSASKDDAAWQANLVDLGLATDAASDRPSGGTPRYMPPEIWAGSTSGDGRARDRFALGLVLAEIASPALRTSADLAGEARKARIVAPFATWCSALLSPDPGARPRASWIAEQARRAARSPQHDHHSPERLAGSIRAAYLGSRRAEITRAARADEIEVRVQGVPGEWLRHAIEMSKKARSLRGEPSAEGRVELVESESMARSRWLVSLVGSTAARWSLASIASANDDRCVSSLIRLIESRAPASWSLVDVERAIASGDASASPPAQFQSDIETALALSGPQRRAAIEAVERGDFDSAPLRRAAADSLRRIGEAGRALALLDQDEDPSVHALRAEIARRAGDRDRALVEARAAIAYDSRDDRAHAILARLAIDKGAPREALTLLANAPRTAATSEARVIALMACGEKQAAENELAIPDSLASTEEARGRVAGLIGYVAHLSGDDTKAGASYATAVLHAERAEALVEEATYLSNLAGSSVNQGDISSALDASRRASLLWEHLGWPDKAANAIMARAAAFSTAGAAHEAMSLGQEARERARSLGDRRAEAWACWAITDVLPAEDAAAREAARFAFSTFDAGNEEDRFRALSRILRHAPGDVDGKTLSWGDALAARETTLVAARLEWWRARAEQFLRERGEGRPESAVLEVCHLVARPAPIAARGPAFAAAAALAARLGDGNAVRLLSRAQADAARTLLSMVPADLREATASVEWVKTAKAIETSGVSAEQIADFETLVRALGTRDRLRPLLEQVLDSLILWTGVERGLLLMSAPNSKLVPRVGRNLARADLEGEQRLLSHSLAAKALELGEPVVAVDAAGEMPSLHASVHALKLRSVLAIPLIARGQSLGVVYLDDRIRRGAFGPKELSWVKLVASLAAVAIADARDQILLRRAARRAERATLALARELSHREAELDVIGRELARTRGSSGTRFRYDAIVGRSPMILEMLKLVDRVTVSTVPVLLIGESGSGKELVARAIHSNGPRGGKTFVGENCSAIPEPLLESTLFGHARGAFTGADRPRAGLFEVAHLGTLFLDEIGEMSLPMQAKLLRVLQEGEIRPLGTEKPRKVDVRVIAATHRNLEQMVRDGKFREDLFYRLNVISIRVPPLRERTDDIPLLVQHFIEKHGGGRRAKISAGALQCLRRFGWPGNVRQLENEVRRAIVLSDELIDVEHLSVDVQRPSDGGDEPVGLRVRPRVDALEAELVQAALVETRGNQTKAAEKLGLSRFGLQKMIKRLGIKAPS